MHLIGWQAGGTGLFCFVIVSEGQGKGWLGFRFQVYCYSQLLSTFSSCAMVFCSDCEVISCSVAFDYFPARPTLPTR